MDEMSLTAMENQRASAIGLKQNTLMLYIVNQGNVLPQYFQNYKAATVIVHRNKIGLQLHLLQAGDDEKGKQELPI